jgi:hypothetical protein
MIFSHVLYQLSYLGAVPNGRRLIANIGRSVQPTPSDAARSFGLFIVRARRFLLFLIDLDVRHAVIAADPAPKVNERATPRAKRPMLLDRWLAADRAGADGNPGRRVAHVPP